ncbi:acyltransferase [Sesbania bispinosa]|nr:acyltransferase [Sesbania bispinosa]
MPQKKENYENPEEIEKNRPELYPTQHPGSKNLTRDSAYITELGSMEEIIRERDN